MTHWPNWVDLIIVTLVLRTCYSGFCHGLVSEAIHLVGALGVTALTINFAPLLIRRLLIWFGWASPTWVSLIGFWGLFFILLGLGRMIVGVCQKLVRWERIHWSIQGGGFVLGAFRGIWWSGIFVLVLASSGISWLQYSEMRSLLGSRMASFSYKTLSVVSRQIPGSTYRSARFFPPMTAE